MNMEQYVIALKRAMWGKMRLSDVFSRLESVEGYRIVGDTSGVRTLIEANGKALGQIEAKLGDFCYIEPVILHTRQ